MLETISEYPVCVACFAVALFCLLQALILKKDFFTPLNVYAFAQTLTLGIAYLKLERYMTDFKIVTWLVWGGAFCAFILGTLTYKYVFKAEHQSQKDDALTFSFSDYDWKKHLKFSLFLLGLFLIGIWGLVRVVGNLILLTEHPADWTSNTVNYGFYAQLFSSSPIVTFFFSVASFKSINPNRWMRNFCRVITIGVILLSLVAYPNRTSLFLSLGFVVILWNFLHKKISPKWILLLILCAVIAFVSISSIRSQYASDSFKGATLRYVLSIPYRYVANNYWNLDYAINPPTDKEIHATTYGIDALAGILEYTFFPSMIRQQMGWDGLFNESIQKMPGYNTTGYLWELYKDFHILGTVLIPFLIAFALSYFYDKTERMPTPCNRMLYALFIYYIGWSFFLAGYKQGVLWLWIFIILLGDFYCRRKVVPKFVK